MENLIFIMRIQYWIWTQWCYQARTLVEANTEFSEFKWSNKVSYIFLFSHLFHEYLSLCILFNDPLRTAEFKTSGLLLTTFHEIVFMRWGHQHFYYAEKMFQKSAQLQL